MGTRTMFQAVIFCMTFLTFALYTVVRKTPSFVQSSLVSEWTPAPQYTMPSNPTWTRQSLFQDQQSAEEFVGYLNALYLFVNALGTVLSGMAADRLDRRLFLTAGMILSAVVMFIYGPVVEWTGGYSRVGYIVLQILNALFLSSGWPCLVSVVYSWFDRRSGSAVLGVWASLSSVGSILGALVVSSVVGYGYEYAFLLTTSMLLAGAVVVFFGLVPSPQEVGLDLLEGGHDHRKDDGTDHEDNDGEFDDDFDIYFNRDENILLEASLYKTGVSHTSYGSSGHTYIAKHTAKTSCSEEGFSESKLEEVHPNYLDNIVQLSDVSAPCVSASVAQTTSANLTAAEHVEVEIENTFLDAGGDTEAETKCKKQCPVSEHKWHSHLTARSHDEDNTHIRIVHCRKNVDNGSHVSERKDPVDFSSNVTSKNSLRPSKHPETASKQSDVVHAKQKAITLWDALLLPGVIPYSLCCGCLKLIIYVFFFWLPFYLTTAHGWSEADADRLSLWYDLGGMVGATLFVLAMGRLKKRALVMVSMLVTSVPLLYGYGVLGWGQDITTNAVLLFCLGGLLSGVNNPLSAVVAADVSQREAVKADTKSVSTVSGLMEGCGVLCAGLGQVIVPYLFPVFGWHSVFYFLMVMTGLTVACIGPLWMSEMKDVVRHCRGL